MIIPNCMIYDVHNNNPNHYRTMMTNLLGNCVHNVYVCRSGDLYDVLIVFKPIHRFKNNQEPFRNALNRRNPVIINYQGNKYEVYEE